MIQIFNFKKAGGNVIIFILLSAILSLSGCLKDEVSPGGEGDQLVRIDAEKNSREWIEEFNYLEDGKLELVENQRSLGRRYVMEYDMDQVTEMHVFRISDSLLIFRYEFAYDEEGRIITIFNYSRNSGGNLPLSIIDTFIYDSSSKIVEQTTRLVSGGETNIISIYKYSWEGNNIEHAEHFDGEGELLYEFFYKYDKGRNYKKGLPLYLLSPIDYSENNIVEMDWLDHHGNLDMVCRPCTNKYTYNLAGLPVTIRTNTGRNSRLTYR